MLLAEFPAVEAAACPALPPAWRSLEDLPPAWRSLEDLPPAAGWRTQTGWMFGGLFPSPGFTLLAGQLENIHLTCDTFVLVTLRAFDNRGLNTEHMSTPSPQIQSGWGKIPHHGPDSEFIYSLSLFIFLSFTFWACFTICVFSLPNGNVSLAPHRNIQERRIWVGFFVKFPAQCCV